MRSVGPSNIIPMPFFDCFLLQIVLGLRYIHKEKHIVHRDLTPNNIMLGENDKVTISKLVVVLIGVSIGTFRSEDEDDYECEFSVVSTRTSKNVGLQTLCACPVRETRTRCRPRPPI